MSSPRLTSDRLSLKRYVVASDRAYLIGTADGNFPPMGFHIDGEMGGLWVPPIKLLDGYWLTLDERPLPPACELRVYPAYAELNYPPVGDITLTRIEFAPDGLPALLIGLTIRNTGADCKSVRLTMTVRSKLMAAYPWSRSTPRNARAFKGKDEGQYDSAAGTLVFNETGKPWYALIGATVWPEVGAVADSFAQTPSENGADDGGSSGRLEWLLAVPQDENVTIWCAVAGSHVSLSQSKTALATALSNPVRLLSEKTLARQTLLERTKVILPDPQLQAAFDAAKLNLADLQKTVTNVQIRDVDAARAYPEPLAVIAQITGLGAGYPDYPHFFSGDAAFANYGLIVSGQWDTATAHLRAMRDVSRAINGDTGKVIHELEFDGSVYYGTNSQPGNTDETALLASAVELVWRWSGDDAFRDEMYEFVRDGMRYITGTLDPDDDGYPAGEGGVEVEDVGSETVAVAVSTWRALGALERLAQSRSDFETANWARAKHDRLEANFDRDWWMPQEGLYADSLDDHNKPIQQRHWINAIPMEARLAQTEHALTALGRLESTAFSQTDGLYHTGMNGGAEERGVRRIWTVSNAVMAVAEANYGRLSEALRYMNGIAAQLDLEMPGALPELLPSPDYDPFMDLRERLMFMQAWSAYGVQWPIIHHFLGIRPNAPAYRLSVIPHLPPTWPDLSVQNLRVGNDVIAVAAARRGKQHTTSVSAPTGWQLLIGHQLPPNAEVELVMLDNMPVSYDVVDSPEGRAVQVETVTGPTRTLVVTVL